MTRMSQMPVLGVVSGLLLSACSQTDAPIFPDADTRTPIRIVEALSSDAMQGRRAGMPGGETARDFLVAELSGRSVDVQAFQRIVTRGDRSLEVSGTNLVVKIDVDDADTGPALLVTAHYDHLGPGENGDIFNGADDNASGVGALFSVLDSFDEVAPDHDVYVAFLDAEETGLTGARELLEALPERPMVNLNFDMIAQNADGEIFAAGTYHTPALKPVVEAAAKDTGMTLRFGHDRPEQGADDWTLQSDHGVFHEAGMPFIYLGVEDHPYYHSPDDEFETLPLDVYRNSLQLAVNTAHALDNVLDEVARTARK